MFRSLLFAVTISIVTSLIAESCGSAFASEVAASEPTKASPISAPCPDSQPVEYVEKKICVPTWVEEIRTVKETCYKKELRERRDQVSPGEEDKNARM